MSVVVVTGSAGLIGSEATRWFAALGCDVVGIDNNMRSYFFGKDASTEWMRERLKKEVPRYRHEEVDVRSQASIFRIFERYGREICLVIHTAAQPSHDWAAREPFTDFGVNAVGTLNVLEATRKFCPDAPFIFTSTNKVYGDNPNLLPLEEHEFRWEISRQHAFHGGINESMSIDGTMHSVFGASKVAADVMVQEYGRYFGLKTACFRGGCLTGPSHSGTELHGFLAYLMKCCATGTSYSVYGYKGKQVRDNIHSTDLVSAFDHFFRKPRSGQIYNIGGGRHSNCSVLEGIAICEEISGRKLDWNYVDLNRQGDHVWWISDTSRFEDHYPGWKLTYNVPAILKAIYLDNQSRWSAKPMAVAARSSKSLAAVAGQGTD